MVCETCIANLNIYVVFLRYEMTWTYCAPQEVLVVFCFNLQAPEEPKCFASEKFYEPNLPKMSEASGHSFQVAVDVDVLIP
jgi:hypothetical protein